MSDFWLGFLPFLPIIVFGVVFIVGMEIESYFYLKKMKKLYEVKPRVYDFSSAALEGIKKLNSLKSPFMAILRHQSSSGK